jgi:hypothetical protein
VKTDTAPSFSRLKANVYLVLSRLWVLFAVNPLQQHPFLAALHNLHNFGKSSVDPQSK